MPFRTGYRRIRCVDVSGVGYLDIMSAMRCGFRSGFGWAVVVCLLAMAGPSFAGAEAGAAPTAELDAAVKAGESLPRMRSLLVSWRGQLILEHYFHSTRSTSLQDIKSASKSVISALVGIAIQRGILPDVNASIAPYFPDLSGATVDTRKKQITIADLLTMRSGLVSTSRQNYGAWVQSPNWVHYVLSRPLLSPPGEQMDYSTGNTHLLSAILTKASGQDTWSFAEEALAKPLGFTLARWTRDPQGFYFGGNEMLMTPREMLKFGELYLHRGQADGRQTVTAAWVADSFAARTQSPISGHQYGYGWWMDEMEGHRVYFAWGFGGQYIFVVPDLELVVVTTSSVSLGDDRREHRDAVYDLVDHLVIGSIASAADRSARASDSGVRSETN